MSLPASRPGTLSVVATPIGNLADLSFRALETLKNADCIACEDTRHSRALCARYGITTKLVSYYREKERERASQLLALLQAGQNIALISDAGTPALSDPGAVLVRLARAAGIPVTAVPGPSALMTAIALAGLEDTTFYFGGFLPATSTARQQALRKLADLPCPLVFYEAPHRIRACLSDALTVLGDRQAQLFRELTKLHEEQRAGSLSELIAQLGDTVRGELVLLIAPGEHKPADSQAKMTELLRQHRDSGLSLKQAVSETAQTLELPRSPVYRAALVLWQDQE